MKNATKVLNRDVTVKECPWLDSDLPKGTLVHEYDGCTYGCISYRGVAVTLIKDETPFFEIPNDALT